MKRFYRALLISVLAGILFFTSGCVLRKSHPNLVSYLLAQTPIGTDVADVESFIEKKSWEISNATPGRNSTYHCSNQESPIVDSVLRAWLGDYRGLPFVVDVSASWEFSQKKLVGICVWKQLDAF